MNTTITMDNLVDELQDKPGAQLAQQRIERGYTTEYIAGKLNLRVRLIELLEADDYYNMPEPVFIKGYLRGYAKLLDLPEQPLLDTFNNLYKTSERKTEKALWQSRRETNRAENTIRWLTSFFALAVLIAVASWWYNNRENESLFSANASHVNNAPNVADADIRLTDLSKMRSLLSSHPQSNITGKVDG